MFWILVSLPLVVPVLVLLYVRRRAPERVWLQLLAAGLTAAGPTMFLTCAAGAMASAISDEEAALRGAVGGFLVGVTVGALALLVMWLWRTIHKRSAREED